MWDNQGAGFGKAHVVRLAFKTPSVTPRSHRNPSREWETKEHVQLQGFQPQCGPRKKKRLRGNLNQPGRKRGDKIRTTSHNPRVVQACPLHHRRPRNHAALKRAEKLAMHTISFRIGRTNGFFKHAACPRHYFSCLSMRTGIPIGKPRHPVSQTRRA